MEKRTYLDKVLVVFGLATIVSSMTDLGIILIPPHFSVPQWVFSAVENISERSIIPMIGVISLLTGLYFLSNNKNKVILNLERLTSLFSLLFGIGISVFALFYVLTMTNIESGAISTIKENYDNAKKQAEMVYDKVNSGNKSVVSQQQYNTYLQKLEERVSDEIKNTKTTLMKKNVKTLVNIFMFIAAFIITGILGFSSSNNAIKRLKFNDSAPGKQ